MRGHAVMGEQGVQEGAEHAPLWGPCVEDQHSGGVVRKSRTQLHKSGFRPRAPSLMMSLEGTMVLKAELSSMNSILTCSMYSSCPDGIRQCAV